MWGGGGGMYGLDVYHRQFYITTEDKYQEQLTLIHIIKNAQVKNQQRTSWGDKLKDIYINENNILVSTSMNNQPAPLTGPYSSLLGGVGGPYIHFGYGPHKICNHTQVQVSGSIKYDTIN